MRRLRGQHMKESRCPLSASGRGTQPVNVSDLEARFDARAEITPDSLKGPPDPLRTGEDPRQRRHSTKLDGPCARLQRDREEEDPSDAGGTERSDEIS